MAFPGTARHTEDPQESYDSAPMLGMMGSHSLIVSSPVGAWTYLVHPMQWQCWPTGGRIVPVLGKAWWAPGLNGNGARAGRGEGFLTSVNGDGWVAVSHGLVGVQAFGAARVIGRDGVVSTLVNRWTVSRWDGGPEEHHHTDAWTRPQQYGRAVVWERDPDSELEARLLIARKVLNVDPDKLPIAAIKIATRPVIRALEAALAKPANPIRDREIRRLYQQLPEAEQERVGLNLRQFKGD